MSDEHTERIELKIPIHAIYVGKRLRPLDEEAIDSLMQSIGEIGLLHPVAVIAYDIRAIPQNEAAKQLSVRYRLCAGLHRLEACKRLGWTDIPALVSPLTGPRAELVEIDENLMSVTLTPAQRATFINRRKALYELLHPETVKGAAQGEGMKRAAAYVSGADSAIYASSFGPHRQLGDEVSKQAPTFTEDTAQKTGRSERSIERDAERGEKIAADVLEEISGTVLDKGTVLDQLKVLPPEQQRTRVKALRFSDKVTITDAQKRCADKYFQAKPGNGKGGAKSKGTQGPPVERHGAVDTALADKLDKSFAALWRLSVETQRVDIRNEADKIERALERKGIVPVSQRMRDAKNYLRNIPNGMKGYILIDPERGPDDADESA